MIISPSCRSLESKVIIPTEHSEVAAEFISSTRKKFQFLMLYVLYFSTSYSLFNLIHRKGKQTLSGNLGKSFLFTFSLK
jgi:hypothetical protein